MGEAYYYDDDELCSDCLDPIDAHCGECGECWCDYECVDEDGYVVLR